MTPEQIVAKCLAQGVVFYMIDDGQFGMDVPNVFLTAKFCKSMREQHDALLPAVQAHLAHEAVQARENDATAIVSAETYEDLPADLIAEGQAVEAAIQAEQDKRLQDAVDAARAGLMPTHWVDHIHTPNDAQYDPSYKPIAIRGGTTLPDPGWWLLGALERAHKLRDKYGETWAQEDRGRPLADAGGPMLWEEIEVVRDWWFEWRHKDLATRDSKGLIK